MAQASIKLKDGTQIQVDGTVDEVLRVLALYPGSVESKSTTGIDVVPTPVTSSKRDQALSWARAQLGRSVQPCKTPGCKFNYGQFGITACSTPNPRADADDIKQENHDSYHPLWNFYCMRFTRSAYSGPAEYAKAHDMYLALSKAGKISTSGDIPVGALIFWFWTTYGHIGIYSGNGNVIHTGVNPQTKAKGIRESPLQEVTGVLDGYNHYQSPRSSYLGWANPPENWLL